MIGIGAKKPKQNASTESHVDLHALLSLGKLLI
jgi:hypothetical protein